MRLFLKLLLAFLTVVLAGVAVVSYLANQAAAREVHGFMFRGGMTTEPALVLELAGYYRGRGTWDGVETLLDAGYGAGGMGGMMDQQLIVVDAAGRVVADTHNALVGQRLPDTELAAGLAIEVDGQRVGALIARGGMRMDGMGMTATAADDLLARVNRAIWLAALAAGGAALVVGGLLAYGLVRPIGRLTRATAALARGDLSQRVPVTTHDEIGDLATAFNAMATDLQKAGQLRRDMTADLAHELRNPLAALQGSLEAVMDGILPPTEENLRPLLEQTQILTRLVDDLRTLALADAGQLPLHRVPTDPGALVRSVVGQFAALADAKKVFLSAEAASDLPFLLLDPQRIAQVLGNLLGNAIRHTPEGGRVACRVSSDEKPLVGARHTALAPRHPSKVTFAVTDTGPGIPPEALLHVFERFYRVDRSRSRAEGGTGLGLAIAKQLVEAHGGHIWAVSDGVSGQGTTVAFSLPANQPTPHTRPA